MNKTAEIALGARSRHQAEAQIKLVNPQRLAATITDFIEWRAFAYWVRLIVESEGCISCEMQLLLRERCPGFLEAAAAYRQSHHREEEFLWLRLIDWIDGHVLDFAISEGWQHALGFYATRDSRLDRIREYWLHCDKLWKSHRPAEFPSFEDWRRAACRGCYPV
jgi:hypothetical protein